MKKIIPLFLLLLLFHNSRAQRIGNSPYPLSTAPDTLFMVNIDAMTNGQQLSVVTLQGLLAKTKPRIMVTRGPSFYKEDLSNRYGVTYDSTYLNDFTGLCQHFKTSFSGYVLCNINDSTSNAAISVCSPFNAIAADSGVAHILDSLSIPQLYNVIGKGESWAFDSLKASYNHKVLVYQQVQKCTYLSDYSVFTGAYHYWDSPIIPFSGGVFSNIGINGVLLGWGSEYSMTYRASQYGMFVHAADWASNLSTYSNFTVNNLAQKNHTSDTLIKPGVHTVCFVMTDGDNIQWVTGDFAVSQSWYGSHRRGLCNIGWTISPALAELAPTIMKYLYDSAATGPVGSDYFIAGPSGMGYDYPDICLAPDSAASISDRMMKKADLSILNLIGSNYTDAQMDVYADQPNVEGIFYYTYGDNYEGMHGYTACRNGKPIITPRYSLTTGNFSVGSLVQSIDTMPKNPYSADGYSLVDVHVWDKNVDSIIRCLQLMDTTIRVVTPDAFVKLFKAGVGCVSTGTGKTLQEDNTALSISPNPFSNSTTLSYRLADEKQVELSLFDMYGNKLRTIQSGWQSAGEHKVDLNTSQLSSGVYFIGLTGSGLNKMQKCMVIK